MAKLVAGQSYVQHAAGTDFAVVAGHAFREAQARYEQVQALDAYSRTLNRRIRDGYRWLDDNSTFHPQYQRGRDLIAELQNKHSEARWQLRDTKVALMGHALTFWQAFDRLTPIEQQRLIMEQGDISHLERPDLNTWQRLMENWQADESALQYGTEGN